MKHFLFACCFFVLLQNSPVFAQQTNNQPDWVVAMLADKPNVWEVDQAYRAYYKSHPFEKNYYTQYYKRWKRSAQDHIDEHGFFIKPDIAATLAFDAEFLRNAKNTTRNAEDWVHVGPNEVWNADNEPHNDQVNVYSLAICQNNQEIMYAGTESGEIYKSTNGGLDWSCVSLDLNLGGVATIAVAPDNENLVFAATGSLLGRSTDGGISWDIVPNTNGFEVREIVFNPENPTIVQFVSEAGLYRSTNSGETFDQILNKSSWDLKYQPGSTSRLYALCSNTSIDRMEFWLSENDGLDWSVSTTGWYNSQDPAREIGGGRLGVSAADPNRVYAYLIGAAKTGDVGFIGVYRSDDAGASWTLPNGPAGGPFTDTHPNLARGWAGWDYHQGYYNCAILVSPTNADSIIFGGLNMWRSNDGALSFSPVGGYLEGTLNLHPDMQDFRAGANGTWATSDGGIYFSNDFFNAHEQERTRGIRGTEYWGFGQGWNIDIFGGGSYHNGNSVHNETYPDNQSIQLGGGEASTGYANPSSSYEMYFSDLGARTIPSSFTDFDNGPFSLFPNESYWSAESSEMEFHPACYSTVFLGRDNKLWKSEDSGISFGLLNSFGNLDNALVHQIEIPYADPNTMYVSQRPNSGGNGTLWKTTDGGENWDILPKPPVTSGSRERIVLSVDLNNAAHIYLAYASGGNGSKVFESTDGGQTWDNLTTTALDGQSIHGINYISGTDGGLYVFTDKTVYHRNNSSTNWELINGGLPTFINCNKAIPFYRDAKMRFASYGKSIWEAPFADQTTHVIAQAMVDKMEFKLWCDDSDTPTFNFECHSVLKHEGATWAWAFEDGTPSTANTLLQTVSFSGTGQKLVTLTITDANGLTNTDSIYVLVAPFDTDSILSEGFETGLDNNWHIVNPDDDVTWTIRNDFGGYGASDNAAFFDNYYYNTDGETDDLVNNFDLSGLDSASISFDVAYQPYSETDFDGLQVLISTDCGVTQTVVYDKSNTDLATAPTDNSYFNPTADQWRTDMVSLLDYVGETSVQVAFRNINGYGNGLYLDNIQLNTVSTPVANKDIASLGHQFAVFPNPMISESPLQINSDYKGLLKLTFYDAKGRTIWHTETVSGQSFSLPSVFAAGTYSVAIETPTFLVARQLVVLK
jgi:photosystem II stability/assembly factor-like uncharacterized protein